MLQLLALYAQQIYWANQFVCKSQT